MVRDSFAPIFNRNDQKIHNTLTFLKTLEIRSLKPAINDKLLL